MELKHGSPRDHCGVQGGEAERDLLLKLVARRPKISDLGPFSLPLFPFKFINSLIKPTRSAPSLVPFSLRNQRTAQKSVANPDGLSRQTNQNRARLDSY
jgi:hypothetical protein